MISEGIRRAGPYATNGVQTDFVFAFKVFDDSDVVVTLTADSVDSIATLTTDYTVALNGDQDIDPGGTVTMLAAPDGPTIVITSDMAVEQPAVFVNSGGFFPRVLNDCLDRLTIYIQQFSEMFTRIPLLPLDPTGFDGFYPVVDGGEWVLVEGTISDNAVLDAFANIGGFAVVNDRVSTAGAATAGDGGDATYVVDTSQAAVSAAASLVIYYGLQNGLSSGAAAAAAAAFEARFRRTDAGGTWFTISQHSVRAQMLRIAADTDATWAQAVADYIAYWRGDAGFASGNYSISNTIQIARGIQVGGGPSGSGGRFVGAGRGFFSDPNYGGTQFTLTAKDRPALAVQGGRHNEIRDLGLLGQLAAYIETNSLGAQTSALDETVAANWDGNGIADKQYAPLAAIALDPRAGVDPGGGSGYPDFGDPAWGGAVQTPYGRGISSLVKIENVDIRGFNVGIALNPSNLYYQTDFVTTAHCQFQSCKWGISIGPTQSRQTTIRNVQFNNVFCCLTNTHNGLEEGQFGCTVVDTSLSACTKWFDFKQQFTGGITFLQCYGEQGLYIGDLRNGSIVDPPISFVGGLADFLFAAASKTGAYPYLLGDPANVIFSTGRVRFQSFQLNVLDVAPLMVMNLDLDGLEVQATAAQSNMGTYARSLAHNGTLGLVGPVEGLRSGMQRVRGQIVNLGTFNLIGSVWTDNTHRASNRAACLPYWMRRAIPASDLDDNYAVNVPLFSYAQANNAITSFAIADGVMTGNLAGITADIGYYTRAIAPGRVFKDDSTGSWWYISAFNYGTGDFTAKILSGWRKPAGVKVLYQAIVISGGYTFTFYQTGFFTPSKPLYGTLTAGSPIITNLHAADGSTAWLPGEIEIGDYLWIDPRDLAPPFTASTYGNKVTAKDLGGAHTITMNGNALVSGTGRLELFIRGPA